MQRFWSKTKQENDCLVWIGYIRKDGYANFYMDGKTWLAHRVAWKLANGDIPDGLEVCHCCDNRKCVNPHHLFLGTLKDNMQDMVKKGRNKPQRLFGEKNPMAKLTRDDIVMIFKLRESGWSLRRIANKFGVNVMQIHRIVHRQNWQHISVADAMLASEEVKKGE